MIEVDIYPVGWLRAWKIHKMKYEWWYFKDRVKKQDWRAVRNTFNGYLAEHVGCRHGAGRGWTQNRAARRAAKICVKANT